MSHPASLAFFQPPSGPEGGGHHAGPGTVPMIPHEVLEEKVIHIKMELLLFTIIKSSIDKCSIENTVAPSEAPLKTLFLLQIVSLRWKGGKCF